jgi:Dyp-type peroxidase family
MTYLEPPNEPVLEMDDIQGMALPGFLKQYQHLIGIQFPSTPVALGRACSLIGELAAQVSTARNTLNDRRDHRESCQSTKAKKEAIKSKEALVGLAISYRGLRRLTPSADSFPSEAFRVGLAERSTLLGDPADPRNEGNPAKWRVGGPGKELDLLVVVAGDNREVVESKAHSLKERFKESSCEIPWDEKGGVRTDLPGHEHFGFDDGVSQPGIRGRASNKPDDFITQRCIAAECIPESWLFGRPGQNLVWPGEFILGYAKSSPDPLVAGPIAIPIPDWSRNGSFLVFRRLRQDVALFWNGMKTLVEKLAKQPGFSKMDPEHLAAKLVGRWQYGAPVNRVFYDDKGLGKDKNANNHFRFDSDTVPLPVPGYEDKYPMATADPAGITCPWAAHIRKVHPRDSGTDMGGRDSAYTRRILRVGIPFGEPAKDRFATDGENARAERGLLFQCIQASIENQFEFLNARWMNDASRPKLPGGHDIFIGQNPNPVDKSVRRCDIFGEGLAQAEVATDAQWVIPTGGGYFFVPSISAIRGVLALSA